MKDLLHQFESKLPEIVFHWRDQETEAEGWLIINSLRGGAAGGGTRMRKGLDKNEVLSLAKTMEVKFTVCGPAIGGAKSGINFDPSDPRKEGVLKRWFKAVSPILKTYYGTGGDMNVNQRTEVIPMIREYGILHPQEGVFNGHFGAHGEKREKRIHQLQDGVSKVIDDVDFLPDTVGIYTIGGMITGYGVAEAVRHYYAIYGGHVHEKKAIIQGFGNVGGGAAFYLAQMGVSIIGIIDRNGGVIKEEGFSLNEVRALYQNRDGNTLKADNMLSFDEINEKIWHLGADIFAPCAASRLVTEDQAKAMIDSGLEMISSGANVPFADEAVFFGPTMEFADTHLSLIPDFISNCGMARVYNYLMAEDRDITDEQIFADVSTTIKKAIQRVYDHNPSRTEISKNAFQIALKQLV